MARLIRIPWLIRLCIVSDAEEIAFMQTDPRVDRCFGRHGHLINHIIVERLTIAAKTADGQALPAFKRRDDAARQARQTELSQDLAHGNLARRLDGAVTQAMAQWLVGDEADPEVIGPLCQSQILHVMREGRTRGDAESWKAAVQFDLYLRSLNFIGNLWRSVSGQFGGARKILSARAENDPATMHAIGIAVHSLVKSFLALHAHLRRPRAADMSAEALAQSSVTGPDGAMRYVHETMDVPFAPHEIPARTLVMLRVQEAAAGHLDLDTAFLSDSWSACPGRAFVQAILTDAARAYRQEVHHDG